MDSKTTAATEKCASPDSVLDLLREQRLLFARLESVAAAQRSLIVGDDAGSLLALLADRQKLSVELGRVSRDLEPMRRGWEQFRQRLSSEDRVEAESLIEETRLRMRSLLERDEQDARLLSARKEATATELRTTHAGAAAMAAYRSPTVAARRLDRSSEGNE